MPRLLAVTFSITITPVCRKWQLFENYMVIMSLFLDGRNGDGGVRSANGMLL
jgi:hypothetical protein